MTDLRKAAQDILDKFDSYRETSCNEKYDDYMEGLRSSLQAEPEQAIWTDSVTGVTSNFPIPYRRQALNNPLQEEPVAWAVDTPYGRGYSYSEEFIAAHPDMPYPSAPANVEALIAEIDALTLYAKDNDEDLLTVNEVQAVLAKYRNTK